MFKIIGLFLVVFLAGCSAKSQWGEADTGGAIYNYQSTDGQKTCVINGTSAREVADVDIEIQKDCSVKVTTKNSTPMGDVFGVLGGLVDRIPMMPPAGAGESK